MPTTVKVETWDGVTAPSLPAVWTQPEGPSLVTIADATLGGTNCLTYPVGSTGESTLLWPDSILGNNRDCRVGYLLECDAGESGKINFTLVSRYGGASGAATTLGAANAYFGTIVFNDGSNSGLLLSRFNAGSETDIVGPGLHNGAFATGTEYWFWLVTNGSTIALQVQRVSDSKWLNGSGSWVTDGSGATTAYTTTDTNLMTAGYAGLAYYTGHATSQPARNKNWTLQLYTGPLAANTCFVEAASATSLTISGTPCQFGVADYDYQLQKSTDGVTWTDHGSPESGVGPGVAPTPVTRTGLTTGTPLYHRWAVTDSAAPPVTEYSNAVGFAPRSATADYYVDTAGDDTHAGTATGTAWATLARAEAQGLIPGDTLNLKGGQTHTGSLTFWGIDASRLDPVYVRSYGTGRATIDCGDTFGLRFVNCGGVLCTNLAIVGSGVSTLGVTTSENAGIEVLNINTDSTQLDFFRFHDITITGTYAGLDGRGHSLTTSGGSGFTDFRCTQVNTDECAYFGIFVRTIPLLDDAGASLAWHQFNLATTIGSTGGNNHLIIFGRTCSGVYVGGCVFTNLYGDTNRSDMNSGSGCVLRECTDSLIERCVAGPNGTRAFEPAGLWLQECTNCYIRWSKAYGMFSHDGIDGDGFDMDGGCVNCGIEGCVSWNNMGAGVLCGPYPGGDAPTGCWVRNHISINDAYASNASSSIFPYEGAEIDIYNCLIYADDSATDIDSLIRHGGGRQRHWNNILITDRTDALPFLSGTFDNGSLATGNLYYAFGSGGPKWNWNGIDYTTLAGFRGGASQEVLNGVDVGQYADPLLSNVGGTPDTTTNPPALFTDYDQTASSPTINAGLDLFATYGIDPGAIDFHGYPNRAGADLTHTGFDIGPTKYGSSSLIPGTGGTPGEVDDVTAQEIIDGVAAAIRDDGLIRDTSFNFTADATAPPTGIVSGIWAILGHLGITRRVKKNDAAKTITVYRQNGTTAWMTNDYSASSGNDQDIHAAT